MRMPVDLLLVWLPQMLEGMLIWADDSKNKFRLKVSSGVLGVLLRVNITLYFLYDSSMTNISHGHPTYHWLIIHQWFGAALRGCAQAGSGPLQ